MFLGSVYFFNRRNTKFNKGNQLFLTLLFIFIFTLLFSGCSEISHTETGSDGEVESEDVAREKPEEEVKAEKDPETDETAEDKAGEKTESSSENLVPLKVHFIDVGQADAAYLEYSDAGESYSILIDSGDWNSDAAVNYLHHLGVKHIDLVVGSHPHADHIGQIDAIIEQFQVDEVWMSGDTASSQVFERVLDAIIDYDVGYHEPRAGEQFEIGKLHIDVVSPSSVNNDLNNGSIVMNVTYGSASFLFTGDAEKEAEAAILSRDEKITADILKVGHHGSDTSSTANFIAAINPKISVISVGKNSYGHPSATVVSRLQEVGSDVYTTQEHGTVIVETDGENYSVTTKSDGNVSPTSSSKNKSTQNKQRTSKKKEKRTKNENCVDINHASIEEVQQIIHIGPARAEDLIDLRPFNSVEELNRIKGIGPARMDDIIAQDLACVGGL